MPSMVRRHIWKYGYRVCLKENSNTVVIGIFGVSPIRGR